MKYHILLALALGFIGCSPQTQSESSPEEVSLLQAKIAVEVSLLPDRTAVITLSLQNCSPKPMEYYYLQPAFRLGATLEIQYQGSPWAPLQPTILAEGSRNLPVIAPQETVRDKILSKDYRTPDIAIPLRAGVFEKGQYTIRYRYQLIDEEILTATTRFSVN